MNVDDNDENKKTMANDKNKINHHQESLLDLNDQNENSNTESNNNLVNAASKNPAVNQESLLDLDNEKSKDESIDNLDGSKAKEDETNLHNDQMMSRRHTTHARAHAHAHLRSSRSS